jgi:cell division protein FtsB
MTTRRKNQAVSLNRRKLAPALQVVPRNVVSAAERSVTNVRSDFLRYFDFHPAMIVLTAVAIIALVCVIYLGQVTAVSNANYVVQALQSQQTALQHEREDLQLQIARAQALPNIEKAARDRLHMVPIGDKYRYLPVPAGPITAFQPQPTSVPQQPISSP